TRRISAYGSIAASWLESATVSRVRSCRPGRPVPFPFPSRLTGRSTHMKPPLNRRDFLAQTAAGAAMAAAASSSNAMAAGLARNALPESATQKVTLGKTGIQVSLVGMGTGSVGSNQASNQTRLGVQGFTKVVRHCIDKGITFFDVADQYGSHTYLREA